MRAVVLTGFMGTGKSEVGRRLAKRLGRAFVDTDELVETRAGKPVAAIFADDGEPRFRALERAAVARRDGARRRGRRARRRRDPRSTRTSRASARTACWSA